MNLHLGGGVKTSRSKGLQASLLLEMLRSWDFLNHGDERINPILRHPEQGPVNSSYRYCRTVNHVIASKSKA